MNTMATAGLRVTDWFMTRDELGWHRVTSIRWMQESAASDAYLVEVKARCGATATDPWDARHDEPDERARCRDCAAVRGQLGVSEPDAANIASIGPEDSERE